MATDFDPYLILQLDPSAGQDAIRIAYENLAALYRDGIADGDRLREIETSYRILSDPDARRAYDERRREALLQRPEVSEELVTGVLVPEGPHARGRVPWTIGDMFMAIGLVIFGLFAIGVPLGVVAEIISGDLSIEDDPAALSVALGANVGVELLLVAVAYRFSVRKYRLTWAALGLRRPDRGGVLFAIGLFAGAWVIITIWGGLLQLADLQPDTSLPEEVFDDWRPLLIVIVLSILAAPFAEEVFFRGFIFGGLHPRWGLIGAMAGSGVLFSLSHVGNPGYIVVLPGIVGIGSWFAWGYHYSGSILPGMAAHFTFNLVAITYSVATS